MYILLIILGAVLLGLNYKAIKKSEGTFAQEMKVAERNTSEVDEKLMEMRSEFAATITELQREISNLREKNVDLVEESKYNKNKEEYYENKDNDVVEENDYINSLLNSVSKVSDNLEIKNEDKNNDTISLEEGNNSLKVDEVKELLLQGIAEDEIAQRLNIGKGEVLLIKELYLK